jgi:hypothetical protein
MGSTQMGAVLVFLRQKRRGFLHLVKKWKLSGALVFFTAEIADAGEPAENHVSTVQ